MQQRAQPDESTLSEHRAFLRDEYLLLQNTYEDFDKRAVTIKGWSATIAAVGLGAGFQYGQREFWMISVGTALVFWVLEAIWKAFQYGHSRRIQEIESYFRSENAHIVPFQAYQTWFDEYFSRSVLGQVWENLWLVPVYLPHVLIVVAGIALFIISLATHGTFPVVPRSTH